MLMINFMGIVLAYTGIALLTALCIGLGTVSLLAMKHGEYED